MITVTIIKENKDGSADAKVKFDKQGLEILVEQGIISMLTKGLDELKARPKKTADGLKKRIKK